MAFNIKNNKGYMVLNTSVFILSKKNYSEENVILSLMKNKQLES